MSSSSYASEASSLDSGVCLEGCATEKHHLAQNSIYKDQDSFQDQSIKIEVLTHKEQQLKAKYPLHSSHFSPAKTRKRGSISEHTFDLIENLTESAKFAALNRQSNILDRIDHIADVATGLVTDLLDVTGEVEMVKKQYEVDHARVEDTILALRSSRTKLEAERARVQDLGARMNGIRFNHMTALAKCQVRKAEYEYRAEETLKLQESHIVLQAELNRTRRERENDLIAMATQMWNLKLMVGDMFMKSESTLRDGMINALEEIDLTLDKLNDSMNASISSGHWSKDPESERSSDETVTPRSLLTDEDHYRIKLQHESESSGCKNTKQYLQDYGACALNDETGSESTVVVKDMEMQDNSYWHNGEYQFWDSQFAC
ncbi:hypothetical protein VTL71DRAFT_6902 [Oculimacula yallundae]|uniref:Uncharacterized protein n=1 Tax=Oculimacula yallundae TaxID=86028 RepID=A0ABR4BV53_9HELO